ncbi:putative ribonuclease III [Dioscorea sansibarensis]
MGTAGIACGRATFIVRASWDTNPSSKPFKPPRSSTLQTTPLSPSPTTAVVVEKATAPYQILSSNRVDGQRGKSEEKYLGYERWLPIAPKVKKPRATYNAASLAYMGDCIYELYARRHFLFPPLCINEYNDRVMKVVRCESQDALLKKLLEDDFLTEEERDVLRWGKNISSSKTRTTKRAGVAVYSRASSLETLIGYLYLTDVKRLEDLMHRLGFSTGASSELIAEMRMNFQKHPSITQNSDSP